MRTRAERRHNDVIKALRKQKICSKFYGWDYYDNLHQYSKNKIHCSCPICAQKTHKRNDVFGESKGRHNGLSYSHGDMVAWIATEQELVAAETSWMEARTAAEYMGM